jgi:hypothetical protein
MLTRTDKPVHGLVALLCAVMIVLAPFARQLHYIFANHQHVYSALSGQIVDAGPRHPEAFAADATAAGGEAPSSALAARERRTDWTPCAVSNLAVVHSLPPMDPGFLLAPRREGAGPALRNSGSLAPSRILRFAPKNSPPADLV